MVRIAFVFCLLGLLAAPASAHPAQPAWWFWLSKPERHGSRKTPGDFTHINTTYRYHSRERYGLFGFLHRRPGSGSLARHHRGTAHRATPRKSPMTL